ncbi:MAG: PD40 domain-containing protein, partial [Bacteroidales bacterium]|nr:PD40 domain-containing protein [Candidatus Colimorpha onthohippi]
MRHILCIMCFVVLSMTAAQAQYYGSTNKKAIKAYQSGIDAMNHGDPGKAIAKYKEALKYDPDFVEMYLSIGEIYMKAKQYNEAIAAYEAFLKADKRHKEWQEGARENISLMRWRMDAVRNPVDFDPTNLGNAINSPDDEYLPALTVDGKTLIFTRRFPANDQTVHTAPFEEDFYISSLNGGSWSKAVRMAEPVNSHDNEGAQCISQDGRIMFFTACGRRDGEGRCDLYMCTRKGNKWSKPRNLGPDVNTPAWESQPSFAIDGRTVYFASNRKGGYGGNDIWKTTFTDGRWSRPENLGPLINTPGNEVSPFIHYNNHTLYFASDGHIGMGGADIFKAEMDENGQWQKPVNLGYPINTERDESGLIVAADGKTAYFSSEREGGYGKQDIYRFELPQEAQTEAVAYQTGVVFNK